MTLAEQTNDTPVRLFSFAVIADTHVNPEDDQSSSPWETNKLANARAKAAVARINALNPDFVVHLGDMVHPTPSQPNYAAAACRFRELFADLGSPLHLAPGNHDVGDKPTFWMPAPLIDVDSLRLYRSQFGKDFYAFDHRDCRFAVLDSQLFNSGLPDEHEQWSWLEAQLETPRRVFLFEHYPPFLYCSDEEEHYDNIAEPARSRLITLLRQHRVEAVFCGHVHNYFYNRIGVTDCYVLPATSAVRHDYMELFPLPPTGNEHGRDATSKFGFFLVEVFSTGHVAHWIRTWGETDSRGAAEPFEWLGTHARGLAVAPIGVDLRHGWADPISIPHTGAVDEFGRKVVRNDYVIAALWELGIRRLRVPFQDLLAPGAARRLAELGAAGHRFIVFMLGLPDQSQRKLLAQHSSILEGIEVIVRHADLTRTAEAASTLRVETGIPLFLSPLGLTTEPAGKHGQFAHMIRHGFPAEANTLVDAVNDCGAGNLDGLVFRVDRNETPFPAIWKIAELVRPKGMRAIIHVRLAGNDPVRDLDNDADTACRVASAAIAAWAFGDRVSICLDTFEDHDRGYFPRHGLVDRFCDLRPAGAVVRRLAASLHHLDWGNARVLAADNAASILASANKTIVLFSSELTIKQARTTLSSIGWPTGVVNGIRLDNGARIALESGRPEACSDSNQISETPILVELESID